MIEHTTNSGRYAPLHLLRRALEEVQRAGVAMSPTQLTLAQLRKDGYTARVVERWNPHAHIRQDIFAFDVLACRPAAHDGLFTRIGGILGVQACSDNGGAGMAAHRAKVLASTDAAVWVASGGRLELWAWSTRRSLERTKAGKRSKRLVHHLRREEITLAMFVPQSSEATA